MSLFDDLYSATAELLRDAKKPLARRALKRKFESALDSAEDRKINAEQDIQKFRESIATQDGFDINKLLEAKNNIEAADNTITLIRDEYKVTFGTEFK